jgi:hypothetical protein
MQARCVLCSIKRSKSEDGEIILLHYHAQVHYSTRSLPLSRLLCFSEVAEFATTILEHVRVRIRPS